MGSAVYQLSSIVCYYSLHYVALVRRPDTGAWQLLNDANVSHIGSWAQVRVKCGRGRLQPCVLFFEKYDSAFPWQQQPMDSPFQASAAGLVPEQWQSRGPQRVASAEVESFQQHVLVEPFSVVSLAASASKPEKSRSDKLKGGPRDILKGMLPDEGAQSRLAPTQRIRAYRPF